MSRVGKLFTLLPVAGYCASPSLLVLGAGGRRSLRRGIFVECIAEPNRSARFGHLFALRLNQYPPFGPWNGSRRTWASDGWVARNRKLNYDFCVLSLRRNVRGSTHARDSSMDGGPSSCCFSSRVAACCQMCLRITNNLYVR